MDRVYELEQELAEKDQMLAEKDEELARSSRQSQGVSSQPGKKTVAQLIGEGKDSQDTPHMEPIQYVSPLDNSFGIEVNFQPLSYGFDYEYGF